MTSPLDEHSRDRGMGDISQRPDLARLRESPPLPAALEDRVVASLKARGWLGPRRDCFWVHPIRSCSQFP